jgi:hypothetical protein
MSTLLKKDEFFVLLSFKRALFAYYRILFIIAFTIKDGFVSKLPSCDYGSKKRNIRAANQGRRTEIIE